MMRKLWQKENSKLNEFIEAFETKDDLLLDQKLVKFDVQGSLAHAKMLLYIHFLISYFSPPSLTFLYASLNDIPFFTNS